ncbi:MAG: hypothetical protein WB557_20315, partial [Solirubrobacteraceae bacterium]
MGHVEGTVSHKPAGGRARATSTRTQRAAAERPEQVSGGLKALYGLLGLILVGYAISLVVRANGASTTWLDGWGVS